MTRKTKRILVSFISLLTISVAGWLLLPAGRFSLFPKVTASGEEIVLAAKTVTFGVDATGVLRATSVENYGAPPGFADYWQFQIVSMAPEGKQVKAGDVLITFDAQ